ncbi:lycopene cyclase [Aquimarina sp. U1-2]|uniref:lycopene cyclase family protein n=1 Tax=Aquimarina sp. U1-2 TaxID=2823141 RepID=UPI001AED008F|nr:lycopene cyclase family protein [Aquimarina sp. U1-2]MBP2833141.1 lycopene cyclase [Aquimarina sp. U1-2]
MQTYDYIITGTGAAGLILIHQLISDPHFDKKQILMIDKEIKNSNDRTWCYWEKGEGSWDEILIKKWHHIYFGSEWFKKKIDILPYQYKMLRSQAFYSFIIDKVKKRANVTIVLENVLTVKDQESKVVVTTDQNKYHGTKVFNSIPFTSAYKDQQKYPVLNQHFIGWFIQTPLPVFDDSMATFMDFAVPQKGNTRFMYVLPFSKTEALFEYTLFSETLLKEEEYESEIENYLNEKGITTYQITEKEKGCIPMTCYEFSQHNSKNLIHIGTAGGWTKPSTGFTFNLTSKKTLQLSAFLKKNDDLSKFGKKTKFWYYDLLFIDLLYKKNYLGASLFSKLFQRNKTSQILKFLDEESKILEDVSIMASLPPLNFLRMLWARMLK